MDPLLLNIPDRILTPRLVLRSPRAGDGAVINEAIVETIEALQRWMPWANPVPGVDDSEIWCRKAQADFIARRQLPLLMFLADGVTFVGSTGIPRLNWHVQAFEIGYWVCKRFEGQGYASEAVNAIASFAFEALKAERVEIRCDARNERSTRVAERCGFQLEGTLRRDERDPSGAVRDTQVFSRIRS
jgi:RimJ/RimL family protein N-acetyltransferase